MSEWVGRPPTFLAAANAAHSQSEKGGFGGKAGGGQFRSADATTLFSWVGWDEFSLVGWWLVGWLVPMGNKKSRKEGMGQKRFWLFLKIARQNGQMPLKYRGWKAWEKVEEEMLGKE